MNTQHTKDHASAFDVLIEHCQETHPHFESPRGQADIAAAKSEHAELLEALRSIIYADENCAYEAPPEFQDAVKLARAALAHATGQEVQS